MKIKLFFFFPSHKSDLAKEKTKQKISTQTNLKNKQGKKKKKRRGWRGSLFPNLPAAPRTTTKREAARAVWGKGNLFKPLTCFLSTSRNYFFFFFLFGVSVPGRSNSPLEESALAAGHQDFKQQTRKETPNKTRRRARTPPTCASPVPQRHGSLLVTLKNTRPSASLSLTAARARTEPDTTEGATPATRREGGP